MTPIQFLDHHFNAILFFIFMLVVVIFAQFKRGQ